MSLSPPEQSDVGPDASSGMDAGTRRRSVQYHRARIRHFLFTSGPNRLSRGWLVRRHHDDPVIARELEIAIPSWPEAFDGLRIAHVSDLHFGELMPLDRAIGIVDIIAAAEPDMVCNTGDLVDLDCHGVGPLAKAIGQIKAPCGNFFVPGNHDELDALDHVSRIVRDAGITVLDDEICVIRRGSETLRVGGIGWARTPVQCRNRIDRTLGKDQSVDLLLSHNPKAFDHAADRDVSLVLSGHTHGGQIARRNRPNANMAIAHRRSAGLYELGPSRLFVTTGAGAWFPLRVNCPAEVAFLTIRRAGLPST
jgi:predicted MPP superfamily phosphohydrolase